MVVPAFNPSIQEWRPEGQKFKVVETNTGHMRLCLKSGEGRSLPFIHNTHRAESIVLVPCLSVTARVGTDSQTHTKMWQVLIKCQTGLLLDLVT